MNRLDFAFDIKATQRGEITGYASVFGGLDSYRDTIAPGAFKKSLAAARAHGRMPPILWQHKTDEPLGPWTTLVEDDRGLRAEGRLLVDQVARAKEVHALVASGAVSGLSIGFRPAKFHNDAKGVRVLTEIDLKEISLVTFPADDDARVTSVKVADVHTVRDLEKFLREHGLSHSASKYIASGWRNPSDKWHEEFHTRLARFARR